MKLTTNFDSGNANVVKLESPDDIQITIKKDNQSDFYQWFHFRLQSEAFIPHQITINNAKDSAYPDGWENYQAVASYDRETWFRVDTRYEDGKLIINHIPEYASVYFAYFAPYSYERHLDLLATMQTEDGVEQVDLGETLDGRDMSMLVVGDPDEDKKKIWVIARQHPGESMAEWFVEGLLERLTDGDDGVARTLLDKAVFYVVPNMNPDGSARGHLRTNAVGSNLNREWQTPSMDKSPEVFLVREKMQEIGVDMFLDIHGDEAIPYNFVAGTEGVPSYDARIKGLEDKFKAAWQLTTPEFQDEYGYPKDAPGEANMTVGCAWVGDHFNCLAYTVEMPFKDHNNVPDSVFGWSDVRSMIFGKDCLTAVLAVVDDLRD